jgi:exonuclease V gamma subunit
LGGPGQALFQKEWQNMTDFSQTIAALDLGKALPRRFLTVDCGAFLCRGLFPHSYEGGLLLANYRDLRGKDLLQGWLLALLLQRLSDMPQRVVLALKNDLRQLQADEQARPNLKDMAELFLQGNRAPSALFIEPAFAWAQQEFSTSQRKQLSANDKAEEELAKKLKESQQAEWQKLFAHQSPPYWRPEHEEAAKTFMLPILKSVQKTEKSISG